MKHVSQAVKFAARKVHPFLKAMSKLRCAPMPSLLSQATFDLAQAAKASTAPP